MSGNDNDAPLLLDVSRLVWRRWTGMRPTGIDRICAAWLKHYGPQAQAVVVHRGGQAILPIRTSQALFRLLGQPELARGDLWRFRAALVALAITRAGHLRDRLEGRDRFWLNPGHTGLNASGLAEWVRRRGLRPIHMVHDLIPITHPQFCRDGEDERHRHRMRTLLETAAGVVANSGHTLSTLQAFADREALPEPPAVVAWPATPVLPSLSKPSTTEPTFVILGTIEGRKNHAFLLSLWRQFLASVDGNRSPKLVIVGRRGWQADEVFASLDFDDFGGRVLELGALDDARLAQVLVGARALLFPSFAEGYGIPLVEALAAGVPVIANDLPVFREIGQGVPELLPLKEGLWRDAVLDYARPNSARRAGQIERLSRFRAPDWPGHFTQVDALMATLKQGGAR